MTQTSMARSHSGGNFHKFLKLTDKDREREKDSKLENEGGHLTREFLIALNTMKTGSAEENLRLIYRSIIIIILS